MSSLSSQLMSGITNFRNPNGPEEQWTRMAQRQRANTLKVLIAEVGYVAVIPFSIIETALSAIAKLFSLVLPIGQARHKCMSNWVKSSAFSVAWSLCNAIINVACNDMIIHERVARACAASGQLFDVPLEALQPSTPTAVGV